MMTIAGVRRSLFIGSAPDAGAAKPLKLAGFGSLVLCADEYQPASSEFPGLAVIHAPLDDSGPPISQIEERIAGSAAGIVAQLINRGDRVVVTCWQGRNRSGLVCALALMILEGLTPQAAIDAVRAARPDALTNDSFRAFLPRFRRPAGVSVHL
jgi:protein-tyrosine phosphatase